MTGANRARKWKNQPAVFTGIILDQYNYLMVDGHVEFLHRAATLSPEDTAANPHERQSGMWTIDPSH